MLYAIFVFLTIIFQALVVRNNFDRWSLERHFIL